MVIFVNRFGQQKKRQFFIELSLSYYSVRSASVNRIIFSSVGRLIST